MPKLRSPVKNALDECRMLAGSAGAARLPASDGDDGALRAAAAGGEDRPPRQPGLHRARHHRADGAAAYHRIVDRGQDSERFHAFASRMVLLALAFLAPGFAGDLHLVLDRAGFPAAAWPCAAGALVAFYSAWFGAMVLMRSRRPHPHRAQWK